MADKTQTVKVKTLIQAPAVEVYMALTNASALGEWLCNSAQAEPRPQGRLYLYWNGGYYASGEFTRLVEGERVAFTYHGRGEPGATRVKINLQAKEEGTLLSLTHDGLGKGKEWNQAAKEFKRGWQNSLENLKSVLETGIDLRLARRPMIGLAAMAEVTEEVAKEAGLAVKHGILIQGLVAGMGAEKAGLQPGDVLLKVNKNKIMSFTDLGQTLQGLQAGDKLKIIYQRGPDKYKGDLELSPRPFPEVPADPTILAQEIQALNATGMVELARSLKGVKETEASYRPSEKSWNIHETLAHLIATERDNQAWIAGLIEGQESDFAYQANQPDRLRAIAGALRTTNGLIKELKRLQAETANLVAGLPPEFVARKRSYWRLAISLMQLPSYHFSDHCQQITTLTTQARDAAARAKQLETATTVEAGQAPSES